VEFQKLIKHEYLTGQVRCHTVLQYYSPTEVAFILYSMCYKLKWALFEKSASQRWHSYC